MRAPERFRDCRTASRAFRALALRPSAFSLQVCRTSPSEKGKYIKIIISLLSTNNTAVVYECASSLVAMSSAPTAIRAAANCYTQLLASQSDNNVKLIVLDRLNELKLNHREARGRPRCDFGPGPAFLRRAH